MARDEGAGSPLILAGLATLLPCALTFAFGTVLLALGGTFGPAGGASSFLAAWAATAGWLLAREGRAAAFPLAAAALAWAVACGWAWHVTDLSADGQGYHQEAVMALRGGWNPFLGRFEGLLGPEGAPPFPSVNAIWINHYPRAAWIVWSAVGSAVGSHEAGKGVNAALALASFLLAAGTLRRTWLPVGWALAVAAAAALNPVALVQAGTFYLDGMGGSLFLCLAAGLVLCAAGDRPRGLAASGAALLLLCNLKFSTLPMAAILCAGAVAYMAFRQGPRAASRTAVPLASAGLAATLVAGFSPYVTNALSQGHPFHPLMGPGKVEVIGANAPHAITDVPGPLRMFASMAAETSNYKGLWYLVYKWPFTYGPLEYVSSGFPDPRIGGFGVLFSGVALLALATVAWLAATRPLARNASMALAAAALAVFASSYANPEAWWARYVPQAWLLPAIAAAAAAGAGTAGRVAAAAVTTAMLACALVSATAAASLARDTRAEYEAMERALVSAGRPVTAHFGPTPAPYYRLRSAGVDVLPVATPEGLACTKPEFLAATYRTARYCR